MTDTERKERVALYLARIGCGMEPEPTLDFLKEVHYRHAVSVPYENLDIVLGTPLSLDEDALFDKIVRRRRGGYCFELNGSFGRLLRAIGFPVEERFARFLRGETEIPMHRHRVVLAQADGRTWFCDVGVGQIAPRFPLLLEEGLLQEQCGEQYRFERDPALGWILTETHHGEWRRYLSFSDEAMYDVDFIQPSYWCETHPDSPFRGKISLSIKTDTGRKTLDGRTFKVFEGETLASVEEIGDTARLRNIYEEIFGLAWEERYGTL